MAVVTDELRARIEAAKGSTAALRGVYAWLTAEVGAARASTLWWAAFAETDAADT